MRRLEREALERGLVARLLDPRCDAPLRDKTLRELRAEDFRDVESRKIFRAITEQRALGKEADLGTVDLIALELLPSVWRERVDCVVTPQDLPELVSRLKEANRREEIELLSLQIAQETKEGQDVSGLVTRLQLLSKPSMDGSAVEAKELAFPKGAYLGLAADFADLYSCAVESPKAFLYLSFLTCLGALVGDCVALQSATRNPARLFMVLLGPSGTSRKSTAIKLTTEFFAKAVESFPIIRGVGSAEGLAKTIQKRSYTNCLLVFDELRAFVDKARIDGSVLLSLVNSLFEDSRAENHTKGHDIELENVHLSLLSACTLETFSNLFNQHFLAIGFPNRLLLALDDAKERKPVPREVPHDLENQLITRLGTILASLRIYTPNNPLLISFTPDAEQLWAEFYHQIPRTVSGIRIDQIGLRLAMLLAVSAGKFEIDAEIAKAAIEIAKWELSVREEVMPIEASNLIAGMEEKIRRTLKRRGPLKIRDLKQYVNASRDGIWVFDTAKANLERAGEVIFEPKNRVLALLDSENAQDAVPVVSSVVNSENGGKP